LEHFNDKLCTFYIVIKASISQLLHLGDLFIGQFLDFKINKNRLKVWALMKTTGKEID